MRKNFFLGLFLLAAGLSGGCRSAASTAASPAVTPFELDRYLGRWYEIARLPHYFERDMTAVTADYSLRPDGKIRVVNSGVRDGNPHSATAVAVPGGDPETGMLRVSFFRPFYADYRIIHLEPDYSAAIVTSGTTDYLWILARSPQISASQLNDYLNRIRNWGFDVEKLEYPQAGSE